MYSFLHVLSQLQAYILNLIQQLKNLKNQASTTTPGLEEVDQEIFIGKAFRRFAPMEFENIFSSDKSLLQGPVYGSDIKEYTNYVSSMADALLMDREHSHDKLIANRAILAIRNLFIDIRGEFIEPIMGAKELRTQAIRLADGFKLRSDNPELGVHTFQNLLTAQQVMHDLDEFFKESSLGYREYRTDPGNAFYFRKT